VAHLEQFNPQVLRRAAYLEWFLIAAAVSCVPLTEPLFGTAAILWVPILWLVVVAVGLMARTSMMRGYEVGADLRALELCGDPEALISALEKLHTLSRLPRRLGNREEGRISHPTLARRVAAIRRAASEGEAEPEEEGRSPLLTVLDSGDGRRVLFEDRKISWLEGVPPETKPNPWSLAAAASRITSLAYPELTELRLQLKGDRSTLKATDTQGRSWEVPVPPMEIAPVQAALDTVDPYLTTPAQPKNRAVDALFRGLPQLAAFLGGLMALVPGLLLSVFGIGVLAALWPRAAMLAGFAAAAVGGVLFLMMHEFLAEGAVWTSATGLVLAAAAAAVGAWYRCRALRTGTPGDTGAVVGGALFGGGAVLATLGCGAWLTMAGTLNTFELHQLAIDFPGPGLLALAAAAAWSLAREPRRRLRWLAVPFLALGLTWLAMADPVFST
jgi:hypothetical protein